MQPGAESRQRAQRVIRVFVSSTFRDMHAERNHLAKFVFPQLRKLCEERGVVWGEVDLRWGVTDEQRAEGEVLPICLEEIRRCRPYFIGLLGERYGWVPDEIAGELIEREPWLAEHLKHSVTELEILHGVLNNPGMAEHAHFYLRDPTYLDRLPPGADPSDFRSEDEAARGKLLALKERIRGSGLPVREGFRDASDLGRLVLEDLTAVINSRFPAGEVVDPLDRDAADHEAFAQSRARVYIGREEYSRTLDEHARGDGPPLVVLGESGCGKSALLANWALRRRGQMPRELLLIHFVGASPYSADWAAMLRRIMGEFKRRFDIGQEIPDKPDELRAAFANWLHMAAAQGCVVLVLDALNQLEDRDGAPDLVWLPPVVPANVRLILSTLPGRPLEDLRRRGWPTLTVEPFDAQERQSFIEQYLAQYTKALTPQRAARIASAPQSANPLYLRTLLEELRLFGVHERLDERIAHYVEARTIPDLYARVLERYEEDYEGERPGLVRDAMTCLWAARRGLSEAELLDILGSDGAPLPRAVWAPLYLAAEQALVNRSGLVGFSHDYFRQAVADRYLRDDGSRKAVHLRLAEHFGGQGLSPRALDEHPWQLAQAEAWDGLRDLLADLRFFEAVWQANQWDVKAYWAGLEDHGVAMAEAYRPVLDAPGLARHRDHVWRLSFLLGDTGHVDDALRLREHLVERFREEGDLANLQASLGNQAVNLTDRGDLDGAMALHREEERICRELGDKAGLGACLGNQALILYARGDLDGAMALLEEKEHICREMGDKAGLQAGLGNQAVMLKARGDLDGAMALLEEKEHICRELGDKGGLSRCLGNQGLILYARGDLDGAVALHKEQERICRELGDKAGLSGCLGNQALILYDRGDLDGAMALFGEQERICRELVDKAGLQACLGNQALILKARGDLDGAMALHQEEERICRELGDKAGLSGSLGNQANIAGDRGDLGGAMALYEEQERICRELRYKEGLQASLGNQALILCDRGDLDGAMALHKEQERICRDLGDKDGLGGCLGNQARILHDRGDLDGAMALLEEKEHICREMGDKGGLSRSLGNQALILCDRGNLDGAMALHKEEERICRELGDKAGLSRSLGNQANILADRGDLDGAMALHKEDERICRELGLVEGLAISLANQALLLAETGRPGEARRAAGEALSLAEQHGLLRLAEGIRGIADSLRS